MQYFGQAAPARDEKRGRLRYQTRAFKVYSSIKVVDALGTRTINHGGSLSVQTKESRISCTGAIASCQRFAVYLLVAFA